MNDILYDVIIFMCGTRNLRSRHNFLEKLLMINNQLIKKFKKIGLPNKPLLIKINHNVKGNYAY